MNEEYSLDLTPVFQKNWEAIHAVDENGERKYKYIINRGSSRSSKTYSLIDVYDMYCRTQMNKRCTVWRDVKTDCKKTVLADALKHFKSTGRYHVANFNKTESIFNYPATGSTFEIHGTDDENTVHGLNQSAAWLNEPYKISRTVFDQIDQRTEDFVFIDLNPLKAHWSEDVAKDKRAIIIPSTFRDNPFCPPEQKRKILSYQPVKMCKVVMQKILEESDARTYDILLNLANLPAKMLEELARCQENERKNSASAYNWSVYGLGEKAEKPNRIFKWKPMKLSEYYALQVPEYYYSDWGAVDPWAVGACKYYDGGLYFRELNYTSENEMRSAMSATERAQIDGDEEGIVSYKFKQFGIPFGGYIACDPNRPTKIKALRAHGWDYAFAAPKPPGSIIDGIDLLNDLQVHYTDDSKNIEYEQENYSRKTDRSGVILDEPEDVDNHHMDGARYIALWLQGEGIIKK